jgi:hypothetical protein
MASKLTKTQKIKQKMFADGFNRVCLWLDKKGWSVESKYEERFPIQSKMNQFMSNKQIEKSKGYRVETLTEEIEAWNRGKKLSERLNLYIDDKKFRKLTNECIYSYIEWATKP